MKAEEKETKGIKEKKRVGTGDRREGGSSRRPRSAVERIRVSWDCCTLAQLVGYKTKHKSNDVTPRSTFHFHAGVDAFESTSICAFDPPPTPPPATLAY